MQFYVSLKSGSFKYNSIQKEMEMNATVIKLEPEIVHIFPYKDTFDNFQNYNEIQNHENVFYYK